MADLVDPRLAPEDTIVLVTSGGNERFRRDDLISHGKRFTDAIKQSPSSEAKVDLTRAESTTTIASFAGYMRYLRCGHISAGAIHKSYIYILIQMHLFCLRLEDFKGADDCMDTILAYYKDWSTIKDPWLPTGADIITSYQRTSPGSPLRKFLVDVHIWARNGGPPLSQACEDFLQDFDKALDREPQTHTKPSLHAQTREKMLRLKNNSPAPTRLIPATALCCDYHQHAPGEEDKCGNKKRKRAMQDTGEEGTRSGKLI